MKKNLVLILIMILFSVTIYAQQKSCRRIYLWDVTLSMKGYNGSENVYDRVVEWLANDIENEKNPSTEIYVIPFQHKIIDVKKIKATESDKQDLKKWIREFKNEDVTRTNISGPLDEAQDKYVKNDRYNDIIILTDGGQNIEGSLEKGNAALKKSLSRYISPDTSASETFVYYVLLTNKAKEETDIIPGGNLKVIDPSQSANKRINLSLKRTQISYNIKERSIDKKLTLEFDCEPIPNETKIKVYTKDEYFKVDTIVNVEDNKLNLKVDYDYEDVRYKIGDIYEVPLFLELINFDEISNNKNVNLTLNNPPVKLKIINKKYKKLTIKIK